MLFKKKPVVSEVELKKHYMFMYNNFVVSSQSELLLVLEQTDNKISVLEFDFLAYKYGYPNDEVGHPLSKYGLGAYGLYKVTNSPWLAEIIDNNRHHPRHRDDMFAGFEHYIARFKDDTLEVICRKMVEKEITKEDLILFIDEQIKRVEKWDPKG